jgi:hypothetical protein
MALTPREIEIKNKLYNQYKANKRNFIKKYGSEAEKVMVGRSIKTARNMATNENKNKIREMIKSVLERGPIEEIDSVSFIQNRKSVSDNPIISNQENPEDTVTMDIPLLIRMLEYAREDAKTDMDLHSVAENMIELSKNGKVLNMDDYNKIIPNEND